MSTTDIKEVVKEKYGQAALRVKTGGSSCCGATAADDSGCDPITSNLYDPSQIGPGPGRGHARLARMRESDCIGEVESWRSGS